MSWWRWVGLAGVAGVAATGAVVARDQRRRTAMSPDDVRERLHRRVEQLDPVETDLETTVGTRPTTAAATSTSPSRDRDRDRARG